MCSLCIAFAQGAGRKVLRIDQPLAGRFLSLTGPLAPRVVVSPLRAISIKLALRDLLSVSYGMISILVISHLRWLFPPFGALRHHLPPTVWWDNKDPQSNPFISSTTISTGCSAPACGGSPAKRARGKPLDERSEAGLFSHGRKPGC